MSRLYEKFMSCKTWVGGNVWAIQAWNTVTKIGNPMTIEDVQSRLSDHISNMTFLCNFPTLNYYLSMGVAMALYTGFLTISFIVMTGGKGVKIFKAIYKKIFDRRGKASTASSKAHFNAYMTDLLSKRAVPAPHAVGMTYDKQRDAFDALEQSYAAVSDDVGTNALLESLTTFFIASGAPAAGDSSTSDMYASYNGNYTRWYKNPDTVLHDTMPEFAPRARKGTLVLIKCQPQKAKSDRLYNFPHNNSANFNNNIRGFCTNIDGRSF